MLDQDPMFYCVGESLSTKSYFCRVKLVSFNTTTPLMFFLGLDTTGQQNYRSNNCFECCRKRGFRYASFRGEPYEPERFQDLPCIQVIEHSDQLQQNARIIDELDVSISFANLAEEMNFVRPEIDEE